MQANPLLVAALKYLEMGWPIFPARKDDLLGRDKTGKEIVLEQSKKPYIDWKIYQERLPTKEEVTAWWTKWPDALIGVATGKLSGFVVVDTEKGADLSLFGLDQMDTPSVDTGGGGVHFYFTYEPLKNAVRFAPLYDIRGDGGYVVVPPSGHKSGGVYSWRLPFGITELAPLPDTIRQALRSPVTGDSSLDKLLREGVKQGERNNSATRVIGAVLAKFPVTQWEDIAWPLAVSWNSTKCSPPLPEKELRDTFESIGKLEMQKRATADKGLPTFSERDMEPDVQEEKGDVVVRIAIADGIAKFTFQDVEQTSQKEMEVLLSVELRIPGSFPRPFTTHMNLFASPTTYESMARQLAKAFGKDLPWDLLLNTATRAAQTYLANRDLSLDLSNISDEESPIIFPPFLVQDGANLLFGDGGTGKTYFCLRLALSLATGKPFLGFSPKEVGGTLFVDYEDNEKTASYRLSRLCAGPDLELDPRIAKKHIRYLNPRGAPLYSIVPAVKKIVEEHNIALVLVDSVASACGSEPEKSESASRYYNALKSIGVTSLSIAHVTKSQGAPQDKAFGSVFWHNLARNTWNLQGEEEAQDELAMIAGQKTKQLGLFHRKSNNSSRAFPIAMKLTYADKYVSFEKGNKGFWVQELPIKVRIRQALGTLGKTLEELRDELPDVAGDTLKMTLARLKASGEVINNSGRGGKWQNLR